MMRLSAIVTACAVVTLLVPVTAGAQDWTGVYVGGSIGGGMQPGDDSEVIEFDTDLNGSFGDTVRTAAGVDAFSPGFCGGLAVGPTAAAGCTDDENGFHVGGRVGYDRQISRIVVGAVLDISRTDITDSATAFSTTPAFYSFTRELTMTAGMRGRGGFTLDRYLLYGTAGAVWGRFDQTFTTSNAVNTFVPVDDNADGNEQGRSAWGYQAGVGVEARIRGNWTVSGEYLFTSLNDSDNSTIRSQGPAPATNPFILVNAAGTDMRRTKSFTFNVLQAGLSYRF